MDGVPTLDESRTIVARIARTTSPSELADILVELIPALTSKENLLASVHDADTPRGFDPPLLDESIAVLGTAGVVAVRCTDPVFLERDEDEPVQLRSVGSGDICYAIFPVEPGRTHRICLRLPNGVIGPRDIPGYHERSYRQQDVPEGELSSRQEIRSSIYPGSTVEYWTYASAGVEPAVPAAVMIWLDGEGFLDPRDAHAHRLKTVVDNLVAAQRIPPAVHVLVSPSREGSYGPPRYQGEEAGIAMRSLQFDTMSATFADMLVNEILTQVSRRFSLRQDAYSRAIAGVSSGGAAAFTAAWFRPQSFSRVHCGIASFVSLRSGVGAWEYPSLIRRESKRNIRVWQSAGNWDLEVDGITGRPDIFLGGSWPLGNLAVAQALRARRYDSEFRFGNAGHNIAQTALDLPESLAWLWRDYDPALTYQEFAPNDPTAPPFRVHLST